MIDWQWIPGVVAAGIAAGVTVRSRVLTKRDLAAGIRKSQADVRALVEQAEEGYIKLLRKQIGAQFQHLQLMWPRPWEPDGRTLTQVEELARQGLDWLGDPLDPQAQHEQMQADAERLLDSYTPKDGED